MTIRRKLNIALLVLFALLLTTTFAVQYIVADISTLALSQARMRELSVFTDDVRAEIYHQVAVAHGFQAKDLDAGWWPDDVIRDVEVRVNHAATDRERQTWSQVAGLIGQLAALPAGDPQWAGVTYQVDSLLRKLRRDYDRRIANALADSAGVVSVAQTTVFFAAIISAFVFVIMTLKIRDWLVKPIEVLNEATIHLGSGQLDHRVSLNGRDELAQLALRINTMARRLAEHQAQLVEAREMAAIGELCAQIAHGLRNPLSGMRAGAQLASKRLGESQELQGVLGELILGIDCMDARITQLFEFTRACELVCAPTPFAELLGLAVEDAGSILRQKSIRVEHDDQTNGVNWMLDKARMAAVVGEIITNAAHHSPENSLIEIRGEVTPSPEKSLRITIQDQGKGIHPNALGRIFDVFYTTRPNGSGMGLALARRVLNRCGGQISVASELGTGTRVTITVGYSGMAT
jgi:signal transduction histidine kinase